MKTTRICPFCGCKTTYFWYASDCAENEKATCSCEWCDAFSCGADFEEAAKNWDNGNIDEMPPDSMSLDKYL